MECLANPVASPLFYCKSNMILLQPRIFSEEVSASAKMKPVSPNTKAFMVPPQRQRVLLPKLIAQHWAREWIPPNPKPPLPLCTIT